MRKRRIAASSVLALLALSAAFAVGLHWPQHDMTPIDNATRPVAVTVGLDMVPQREPLQFFARIELPDVVDLLPQTAEGFGDAPSLLVVTRHVRDIASSVSSGDFVGEVSGVPIFALSQDIPLYRDIRLGMRGQDIAALQEELARLGYFSGDITGQVNMALINAMDQWFIAAGYRLPLLGDSRGLPLAQVIAIPPGDHQVAASSPVGTHLDAQTPLMSIYVGQSDIVGQVNILQAQTLQVGDRLELSAAGLSPVETQIRSIGDFTELPDGLMGHELFLDVPDTWDIAELAVTQVSARELSPIDLAAAIPLIAVREDAGGTHVLLECGTQDTEPPRVAISVLRQVGGHAIVAQPLNLDQDARIAVGTASCQ